MGIKLNPVDLAWAAGIFEGEGCITHSSPKRLWDARLALMMADRDVVERFAKIVDTERPSTAWRWHPPRAQERGWKEQWRWSCSGRKSIDVLRLLLPFLGERRSCRAEWFIEAFEQHLEETTSERPCASCQNDFRPRYGANANTVFCSVRCKNLSRRRAL